MGTTTGSTSRSTTLGRKVAHSIAMMIVSLTVILGGSLAAAQPASAATFRAGARWGQADILLEGGETRQAATSYWGTVVVCSGVTVAGARGGVGGVLLTSVSCASIVSVCAAQAYYAGKWAGITLYPGGFFCWKY